MNLECCKLKKLLTYAINVVNGIMKKDQNKKNGNL
jgi:hypothetical protein